MVKFFIKRSLLDSLIQEIHEDRFILYEQPIKYRKRHTAEIKESSIKLSTGSITAAYMSPRVLLLGVLCLLGGGTLSILPSDHIYCLVVKETGPVKHVS